MKQSSTKTRPRGNCSDGGRLRTAYSLTSDWMSGSSQSIAEEQKRCRLNGLGTLSVLPDRFVLKILKRVDIADLLQASAVSRAFYQCASWSDVWKALCLQRWNGHFVFRVSWKITTLLPDGLAEIPARLLDSPSLHLKGFFSDEMYRRWWYSTHCKTIAHWDTPREEEEETDAQEADPVLPAPPFPTAGPPANRIQIERIPIHALSVDEFRARYLIPNRPVILTGVTASWRSAGAPSRAPAGVSTSINAPSIDADSENEIGPSLDDTSDSDDELAATAGFVSGPDSPYFWSPKSLAKRFQNDLFKINTYSHSGRRVKMTMQDYVHYMQTNADAYPLYIFDSKFGERSPEMLKDYDVPPHFWEDLFAVLPDDSAARPPHRWIVMGPARSGTPFHTDPNGTSAWNALLWGRKRWALYPPGAGPLTPPGVNPRTLKAPHPLVWWSEIYPHLTAHALPPLEFVQEPGDFLFVPSGWWHTVLNLGDSVAVTQNFANLENLDAVVFTMVREGRTKLVEYWKRRLMPVRPELFFRISNQQRILRLEEQAQATHYYKAKLRNEKKLRRQLEERVRELERAASVVASAAATK